MENGQFRSTSFLHDDEHFHFARIAVASHEVGEPHNHDFFEVLFVEQGNAAHLVNGQRHALPEGTLVFIRPEDSHALAAEGDGPVRLVNVLFRAATAQHLERRYGGELSGRFFWAQGSTPATVTLTGESLARARRLIEMLHLAPRTLAQIEEFLLALMLRVVAQPETAVGRVPDWLAAACARAREPVVFREGAAGFVRAAGRGHEHVCRKTREHLGVTPSAFINRIRMEHAAHLLEDDTKSVADVADDCGIENMSHFYRVFRAHYGVTPKAYRKQHQKSPF